MRITELLVQQFGVWRDVSFPVNRAGLNVFYGPNEAGKSTLLRFLRGVLYGYRSTGNTAGTYAAGALRLEHDGIAWEVERTRPERSDAARGTARIARVDGNAPGSAETADAWLAQALGGVDEETYEKVFAVGLEEMQELATLHGDEVAQRIYGTSLGPEGRRLLDAIEKCRSEQEHLTAAGDDGLTRLLDRDAAARRELTALGDLRDRHDALMVERAELEKRLVAKRTEQANLQRELRGLQLMVRAWEPWREVDGLRRELGTLPNVRSFPERGIERLDAIDQEIDSLKKQRSRLLAEAKALRARARGATRDDVIAGNRRGVWSLLDQRDAWQADNARLPQTETSERDAKREFDARLAALGSEWSMQRLEQIDVSPERQHQLATLARKYDRSLSTRNRMRKRLKGWSRTSRVQSAEVATRLKELDAPRLEESLNTTRQQVADLEELSKLRIELADRDRERDELKTHTARLDKGLVWPEWLPIILWFFALGGIAAAALGFYQGFHQNGAAGVMWVLLGMTCGGLAFALRSHYDGAVQETADHWGRRLHESENRARQAEQSIDRLKRRSPWLHQYDWVMSPARAASTSRGDTEVDPGDELLDATRVRLKEFERLSDVNQRVARRRGRLTTLRTRFQHVHRDVTAARQEWCSLLRELGLPDSTRVDEAFTKWKNIVAARQAYDRWRVASENAGESRRRVGEFDQRVREFSRRIGENQDNNSQSTVSRLATWEQRLGGLDALEQEGSKLLAEARGKRRDVVELTKRLKGLRAQRRALLREAKCRTRPQFERKARAWARRIELDELLELAQSELARVASSEPELAITDDDFRAYDADRAATRLAACRDEIETASEDLEAIHRRQGGVAQELELLEADDREIGRRAAAAAASDALTRRAEDWASLNVAQRVLDRVRTRYERVAQPATLIAASTWLERLTRGRFRTVCTPLGSRELRVEDERGDSRTVEQLSTGTREQLFLAVRLALIHDLRQKGVDLPVVLDDVLVNFDQQRSEAALETLIEFAGGQQVLLFTCHRHLMQLAEERQIEPVRLPVREAAGEPREERRAG